MPSLVPYTDQQPPTNRYLYQIIPPPRAGVCCVSAMAWLDARRDVRGVYQDRRCRRCGFTVRVLLREIPNTALATTLRESLARAFLRTVPA